MLKIVYLFFINAIVIAIATLLATHLSDNFIVILSVVLVTSLFTSILFAQMFTQEIQNIKDYLAKISDKNYTSLPLSYSIYEFGFLSKHLQKMARRLKNQKEARIHTTAKLKLSIRQKDEIISAIGHEFKNPIAAIMGYAQTISEDKEMPTNIRERFLDKIYANSKRITNMLDRLNLAMKFEKGKLQVQPSDFDILPMLIEVKETLEAKYKNRTIHIDATHYSLHADCTLINLAITNLCDNALKYSENDIFIVFANKTFSISDKGLGIAKNDIGKIKEKFYRVKDNTWDNSLGLGLALVEYILNLHQSTLEIKSTLHKGSTFSFKLSS